MSDNDMKHSSDEQDEDFPAIQVNMKLSKLTKMLDITVNAPQRNHVAELFLMKLRRQKVRHEIIFQTQMMSDDDLSLLMKTLTGHTFDAYELYALRNNPMMIQHEVDVAARKCGDMYYWVRRMFMDAVKDAIQHSKDKFSLVSYYLEGLPKDLGRFSVNSILNHSSVFGLEKKSGLYKEKLMLLPVDILGTKLQNNQVTVIVDVPVNVESHISKDKFVLYEKVNLDKTVFEETCNPNNGNISKFLKDLVVICSLAKKGLRKTGKKKFAKKNFENVLLKNQQRGHGKKKHYYRSRLDKSKNH